MTTTVSTTVPARVRPARTRTGHTHEFTLNGLAGTLTITELPDGRPGEIFLRAAKQGSTLAGLCETLSITTSLALQHHTPVADIVHRLLNMRFEPSGTTGDPDVPVATSLADYLARRLATDYLDRGKHASSGVIGERTSVSMASRPETRLLSH